MGNSARIAALVAIMALVGCGTLRGPSPFGGGGGAAPAPVDLPQAQEGPLVDQVVSLFAEPTPGGVIVTAVGLPPTQGYWDAELTRVPGISGALVLNFEIASPPTPKAAGTQPSREVLAGRYISTQDLGGATTIIVQGARNQRSVRRQ